MNYYKVFFEDNQAAYATVLKSVELDSARIDMVDGKRVVRWLNIFAESERDGIKLANKVIQGYLHFLESDTGAKPE